MEEEEQFVNIDLNDDNICSVCKLETDTGTLSFCHVCFELSIEGKEQDPVNCCLFTHFCQEQPKWSKQNGLNKVKLFSYNSVCSKSFTCLCLKATFQ